MGVARDYLSQKSKEHFVRFQQLEIQATKILEYSQGGRHLTFTPHGISHISKVEQAYDYLMSEDEISKMNAAELFCLLCATYFHDVLMIPRTVGDEAKARARHAEIAGDFLSNNCSSLSITEHEAFVIGEVIRGHHVWDFSDLQEEHVLGSHLVEIRKLAACLSMADLCHADESRAPQIVFQHLKFDSESAYHWRRHMMISGVTRKDDQLVMSAIAFSDEGANAIDEYAQTIRNQLTICRPYFRSKLTPISDVNCRINRKRSPIDQDLRFKTNTSSILKLLVEGVYQRSDVFVRELIQNGIDACYIASAKHQKKGLRHSGCVAITEFHDIDGSLVAVRVDDNGIGMSIEDVQDTLLWIGQTNADRATVRDLLAQTTKKELIATFGIGLLSCFKVASSIEVRTSRLGSQPMSLAISGLSEVIEVTESDDTSPGTTVLLRIKPEFANLSVVESVEYYCKMVSLVDIKPISLDYSDKLAKLARSEFFGIIDAQDAIIDHVSPSKSATVVNIDGDDFSGWIEIPVDSVKDLSATTGQITILNDGIYVCEEPSSKWLPNYMSMFDIVVNFAAKSIDLPVSRDKITENVKFFEKKKQIFSLSDRLIAEVSSKTSGPDRKRNALLITLMWKLANESDRTSILSMLDDYYVETYNKQKILLSSAIKWNGQINLHYVNGSYVEELCKFNEDMLYSMKNSISDLQATIAQARGELVISAVREDIKSDRISYLLEADLIQAYLTQKGVSATDLFNDIYVQGALRSKPIAKECRDLIGSNVKFVEVSEMPKKYGWKIGPETWINTAHPLMEVLYNRLQEGIKTSQHKIAAEVIVALISNNFDYAIRRCIRVFGP